MHYNQNMNFIDLVCVQCNTKFQRTVSSHNRSLRQHPNSPIFCSTRCRLGGGHWTPCIQCSLSTLNPRFCCRSCAAIYNNHHMPKRTKTQKFCKTCGHPSKHSTNHCRYCRKYKNYGIITLSKLKNDCGSRNTYSTVVRQHARGIADSAGLLRECAYCGYSLCVDCCHIRPVANFPFEANLNEVNDVQNLVGLCRNHHWELDHGFLILVPGVGFQPTASSL